MNSITIEQKLPGLNDYINSNRANKRGGNHLKQMTEKTICSHILLSELKIDKTKQYDLTVVWETKDNRRDSDNVFFAIKFLLDSFVKMGIIDNDSRKHIRHINNLIYTTNRNAVTVTFNETSH